MSMQHQLEGAHVVTSQHPIRLWPGIAAGALLVLGWTLVPLVLPDGGYIGLFVAFIAALAIVVWWVFFSRAPWIERLGALAAMVVAAFATRPLLDKSIATGAMGGLPFILAILALSPALVVWAAAWGNRSVGLRRTMLVATMLVVSGAFGLLRTDGIASDGFQFKWRWTPTAEERLLAESAREPALVPPPAPATTATPPTGTAPVPVPGAPAATAPERPRGDEGVETVPPATIQTKPADWPGFRGPDRDSVVRGVRIETDWAKSPPVAMWRRPIGPGWSSFAVDGDLLYTQEQRGDEELVVAYKVSTGEPVWRHRDPVRFWESNGGAGPRGTPTLSNGRVYAFGGTGILNALDAKTGASIWSRNVAKDSGTEIPMWGFSSSPLVLDDIVVVAASGKLAAYDIGSGKPRWFGPEGGFSYSSPHRLTVAGMTQILLLAGSHATSVSPRDGAVLWKHAWPGGAIVQPAVVGDGHILIHALGGAGGAGIRRLAVTQAPQGGWTVEERWTSTGLKPYYDDFVVHKGYAFGADGSILACIDLADGTRKWKGGRYGGGQVLLLPDQDLLLVLGEEGELALVSATPEQFKELARVPGIEGKTWNHPVLVRDVLLVRNGEEMAAFRLPVIR
jgi:outer membrane protein assembly factor BamB